MSRALVPSHAVFDDFLLPGDAAALLDFAFTHRGGFQPTEIMRSAHRTAERDWRKSFEYHGELGRIVAPFEHAIRERFDAICAAAGTRPFPLHALDLALSAHCDGGFYRQHFDTMTAGERDGTAGDRIVSCVYYFHREPRVFSGGDLLMHPLAGAADPVTIAPRHNRLAVFPSIAPHEVAETHVPGDAWENARFSLNCWLLRARD